MSHPSPSRYPRERSATRGGSSSSSSSSQAYQSSRPPRNYLESITRTASPPYQSPYAPVDPSSQYLTVPDLHYPTGVTSRASSTSRPQTAAAMSTYSSASDRDSIYSSPGPQDYNVGGISTMSNPTALNTTSLPSLLLSLRSHTINTLPALRRTERLLASLPPNTTPQLPDLKLALQTAWKYYVDHHHLLNELRGLTKSYPFSETLLEQAKAGVVVGGGNYCYGVLKRVKYQEGLVRVHARALAAKPVMWGGRKPSGAEVQKLAVACEGEWVRVVGLLLRHWEG
ncbi:MAG: hypothetical protein Q9186_003909 [Xanthomendoza sp. 1 TL-2023]